METYCLKCKKNTKNINPKISSSSNGKAKISYLNVQYAVVKNKKTLVACNV